MAHLTLTLQDAVRAILATTPPPAGEPSTRKNKAKKAQKGKSAQKNTGRGAPTKPNGLDEDCSLN